MAKAMHLDAAGFEKALGKSGVLVADFWAGWCMPCKMLAPSIDKLAEEYDGRATVGKVDIDEEQALAARYGVQSIPTVIVFKNGQILATLVGVMMRTRRRSTRRCKTGQTKKRGASGIHLKPRVLAVYRYVCLLPYTRPAG